MPYRLCEDFLNLRLFTLLSIFYVHIVSVFIIWLPATCYRLSLFNAITTSIVMLALVLSSYASTLYITSFANKQQTVEARVSSRYCDDCGIFKPQLCHHCRICGSCVYRMDHHCWFTRTCIGRFNLKSYLLFLFYLGLGSLWSLLGMINYFELLIDFFFATGPEVKTCYQYSPLVTNILALICIILDTFGLSIAAYLLFRQLVIIFFRTTLIDLDHCIKRFGTLMPEEGLRMTVRIFVYSCSF